LATPPACETVRTLTFMPAGSRKTLEPRHFPMQ
jgi:hypothetical protein